MAQACMPDAFFELAAHHLPPDQAIGPEGGRPRMDHRVVLNVLWFVLATGCRWDIGQPYCLHFQICPGLRFWKSSPAASSRSSPIVACSVLRREVNKRLHRPFDASVDLATREMLR